MKIIKISTNENINQKTFFIYNLSYRMFSIMEIKFKQKIMPHKGMENTPMMLRIEKNIVTTP